MVEQLYSIEEDLGYFVLKIGMGWPYEVEVKAILNSLILSAVRWTGYAREIRDHGG